MRDKKKKGFKERVRNRDENAGVTGVPLCLRGSLGCVQAQSGWRKEEEKRKSSQGKFFPFSSAL